MTRSIFILRFEYIFYIYGFPNIPGWTRDVARLAAQIITGVGFLGAGAIMNRTNGGIKGLTTAATIWIVMAIGIACGSFNFILAILSTLLIIVVLTVSKRYDCTIHGLSTDLFEKGDKKEVQLTFQVVFSSGEDRVTEYVSELERETKATSIQLLGHR